MTNSLEGESKLPSQERPKVVRSVTYKITGDRMRQWLKSVSDESDVNCYYTLNTVKGKPTNLDIHISGESDDEDIEKVNTAIDNQWEEFKRLSKESEEERESEKTD